MVQDQLTVLSKPVLRASGGSLQEQPNSGSMRITVTAIAGMSSGLSYVALGLGSCHASQAPAATPLFGFARSLARAWTG
jgi:hypothetical protein